jgi:hypothetical protein
MSLNSIRESDDDAIFICVNEFVIEEDALDRLH